MRAAGEDFLLTHQCRGVSFTVVGADNNMITGNEISLNPDPTKNQFTFGIGFSGGGADSNDGNVVSNKASFKKIMVTAPFSGPVTVTLSHDSLVIRTDMITACRQSSTGLSCREP